MMEEDEVGSDVVAMVEMIRDRETLRRNKRMLVYKRQ
jgi:hypothetical protein